MEILLNVYDVTSTPGDPKATVVRLNNLTRAAAVGGVFHGAVQIGSVEFSYGFCERGTGLYAVEARKNPMYQYRETVSLGPTTKSMEEIKGIIQDMKALWPGFSYDLLNRNCCHFCAELAQKLEVQPVPGWLNRFASAAATTVAVTQETVRTMQDIGQELGRLSGESLSFMRSTWQRTVAAATQQQQQLAQRLQQQRTSGRPQNSVGQAAAPASAGAEQQQQQRQEAPSVAAASGPVYDHPSDYYGRQRSADSSSSSVGSSDPARPGSSGALASSASAAGQSLIAGMQQLKVTTNKLGLKLQQQIMRGNAAEQQSWEQALSPTAAPAGGSTTAASGSLGGAQQQAAGRTEQQQQQEDVGLLQQGLVPGVQPKLADQFCVSSSSIGHENDPFASLLDENGDHHPVMRQQQQQQWSSAQNGPNDLLL